MTRSLPPARTLPRPWMGALCCILLVGTLSCVEERPLEPGQMSVSVDLTRCGCTAAGAEVILIKGSGEERCAAQSGQWSPDQPLVLKSIPVAESPSFSVTLAVTCGEQPVPDLSVPITDEACCDQLQRCIHEDQCSEPPPYCHTCSMAFGACEEAINKLNIEVDFSNPPQVEEAMKLLCHDNDQPAECCQHLEPCLRELEQMCQVEQGEVTCVECDQAAQTCKLTSEAGNVELTQGQAQETYKQLCSDEEGAPDQNPGSRTDDPCIACYATSSLVVSSGQQATLVAVPADADKCVPEEISEARQLAPCKP